MSETSPNLHEFTVSEISGLLKKTVEDTFSYVRVRGEVSGFKRAPSGHLYFNLKDDQAVLGAVCWRGLAEKLPFKPEDGLEVVAEGKLSTYPARSNYQMVVAKLEPAGEGALMALLEERKRKLAAEGLFAEEHKKPLPAIPGVIGVITSPTGAVIRDILHRLEERFPRHVVVWPVQVQGGDAAPQVARAIEGFNGLDETSKIPKPDLLIVARGGGSLEDLWAFNEEVVVRAAAASAIPLISAVGHETDTTLIDFAADRRAPTPTAAAEMAVPVRRDLALKINDLNQRRERARDRYFTRLNERLSGLSRGIPTPKDILALGIQKLDDFTLRLSQALAVQQKARFQTFRGLARTLESLSYHSILQRGYAVVRDSAGKAVLAAAGIPPGKALDIEFKDGHVPVVTKKGGTGGEKKPLRHKKAKTGNKDQGDLF